MYSFSNLEPICFSMSSSNCCFLTCTQISQEAGQVVWYSHLLKNFPQFVVIHTVKGFGIVRSRCFSGTLLLFQWSNGCWQFDLPSWSVIKQNLLYISMVRNRYTGKRIMNGYYLACQKCPGIHIIAYLYNCHFLHDYHALRLCTSCFKRGLVITLDPQPHISYKVQY